MNDKTNELKEEYEITTENLIKQVVKQAKEETNDKQSFLEKCKDGLTITNEKIFLKVYY